MRTIIALAIILTMTACATSGRKITQDQLAQVVSGQTTRVDLIAMFGPPTSEVYSSDGTQILGWGYAHVGFMGTNTEVQGVSMVIGADGIVTGYTRTGSAPLNQTATAQPVTQQAARPASVQPQPLGEQAYKQQQVDQLMQQNLPYEEYQKRYRQIMGE
jgi:hypothetical protein